MTRGFNRRRVILQRFSTKWNRINIIFIHIMYLSLICFVFLLAIFDLWVGVSNDAVNFLNTAIGARVSRFRNILIVAAVGVFVGATLSNGMMDIARHGIFQPAMFSFEELMCIFLAVMVTDVVLLDVFNSLGMPTSTTVSLVFELLGGTFILALVKIAGDSSLDMGSLLNTEKALSVIMGIFLSVAIAFVCGTAVQWLSRLILTFNYRPRLKYFIGLFGGLAFTTIAYFVVVKGLKGSPVITPEISEWIGTHTSQLAIGMFVCSAIVMQMLHFMKVNIFKIVIFIGTFALAMAFASNDLVNFVGVPLAALSSYEAFSATPGADASTFMMSALNESAQTPLYFLILSGVIMVMALCMSKKAHNVIKTSVDLSRQDQGDEMFGSSGVARSIVRGSNNVARVLTIVLPAGFFRWLDRRFNKEEAIMAEGAAFDLVRASVNLVMAALLIIVGTSLKLPLSTTYVTFIVAMGTSLADRAWSRESAVFRITGVLNVIGGWFITAGVAFTACAFVAIIMYFGGVVAMVAFVCLAVFLIVRSNFMKTEKKQADERDTIFRDMMATKDLQERWVLLSRHVKLSQERLLSEILDNYRDTVHGFVQEDLSRLRKASREIQHVKQRMRKVRKREVIGLRNIDPALSLQKNTWFHLGSNSGEQMNYGLRRMIDPCLEHVDNHFNPLPKASREEMTAVAQTVENYLAIAIQYFCDNELGKMDQLAAEIDQYTIHISGIRKQQADHLSTDPTVDMNVHLVYLNLLQESQLLLSELRHFLRAFKNFQA